MLRGGRKNERHENRVFSVDPNVHFGMVVGHMPLPLMLYNAREGTMVTQV
jgi:hypothetical protein